MSSDLNRSLKYSALLGTLTAFVYLFRDNEFFQFLDYYTWMGYYTTQLMFMALFVSLAFVLIGALIRGTISAKDAVQLGRQLAKEMEIAKSIDSKSQKTEEFVHSIEILNFDVGRKLQIIAPEPLSVDTNPIVTVNRKIMIAAMILLVLLVLLYYLI